MKLQLILPPTTQEFSRSKWMMPLGLLSIATRVKQKMSSVTIEVLDGNQVSENDIIAMLDSEYVGISINVANFDAAKRIAKAAKAIKATVIAGGTLVTSYEKKLSQCMPYVDIMINGDGEDALPSIIAGNTPKDIQHQIPLDELPIIDRAFLDAKLYFNAYQQTHPHAPYKRPLTFYTQKGCRHRLQNGGCKFCSIVDKGWRVRNPANIWQEIQFLVDTYQADLLWDISDSIASNVSWLEEFVTNRPKSIDCDLYFYIRPDEVSEYTAQLLSRINCKRVFLGIESGNDRFLLEANKGCNTDQSTKAAKLLSKYNIGIHLSFILGFPGENKITISKTQRHIQELLPYNVEVINAHIMTPEPGSAYFSMLTKRTNEIVLSPRKLRSEWAKYFCECSIAEMHDACEKILLLLPREPERDYGEAMPNE